MLNDYIDVHIRGEIGVEVTLLDIVAATKDNTKKYNFIIDSIGGYVDEAFAMANYIEKLSNASTTVVKAYSSASIVFLAANTRFASSNALIMIHNPWMKSKGDKDTLRAYADTLESIETKMEQYYVARTGVDKETISTLMQQETYFTGQNAISLGFATHVLESMQAVAKIDINKINENKTDNFNSNNLNFKNEDTMTESKLINALREIFSVKAVEESVETKVEEKAEEQEAVVEAVEPVAMTPEEKQEIVDAVLESVQEFLVNLKEEMLQMQEGQVEAVKAMAREIKTVYSPPTENFNTEIGAVDVKKQMLNVAKTKRK